VFPVLKSRVVSEIHPITMPPAAELEAKPIFAVGLRAGPIKSGYENL
jgi:hypothetical protein